MVHSSLRMKRVSNPTPTLLRTPLSAVVEISLNLSYSTASSKLWSGTNRNVGVSKGKPPHGNVLHRGPMPSVQHVQPRHYLPPLRHRQVRGHKVRHHLALVRGSVSAAELQSRLRRRLLRFHQSLPG